MIYLLLRHASPAHQPAVFVSYYQVSFFLICALPLTHWESSTRTFTPFPKSFWQSTVGMSFSNTNPTINTKRSSSSNSPISHSTEFPLVTHPSSPSLSGHRARRPQSPSRSRPGSPSSESYFRTAPDTPTVELTCPVCNESLLLSSVTLDEHVDYCTMKRTIGQGREMRLEGIEDVPGATPYTLTGVGDAHEFGGFGVSETMVGFEWPMTLRRKRLLGRLALRRRPLIDFEGHARH